MRSQHQSIWLELRELSQTLLHDLGRCEADLRKGDHAWVRRHYVRALFAAIEGVTWAMKVVAAENQRLRSGSFSSGEIALLEEHTFELDDSGKVQRRAARIRLAPNIRFAFDALTRSEGVVFQLSVGESGWQALLTAIKIRDRLMHPKNSAALAVTDTELLTVRSACDWWAGEVSRLFSTAMSRH